MATLDPISPPPPRRQRKRLCVWHPDPSDRQGRCHSRPRNISPSVSSRSGSRTSRRPSGTSCAAASSGKASISPASLAGRSSSGRRWKRCSAKEPMGAKVRVDRRNNRLFLDIHVRGRRTRVFAELPATARNLKILEAKAETIEREAFLGTLDLNRHFPRRRPRPVTLRDGYAEGTRKKASEC